MAKNDLKRKEMLKKRREKQLSAIPTKPVKVRGKYVPAGVNKNLKASNR